MKKPRFKKANVIFEDSKYNYSTSVNGSLSDKEIINYFKNKWFNMGDLEDDMQKCIDCTVEPSTV
jgi:hypothetical protein